MSPSPMQERRLSRAVQALNLALLLLLFVGSLWVYPSLPGEIPKHIGFGGDVTYWETTLLRWLFFPFLAAFFVASMYGMVYHAARDPQRVLICDFPNKDIYRTLSLRHKQIVTDIIRASFHASLTPCLITFIVIKVEFYLIAVTSWTKSPAFMRWLAWGVMLVGIIGVLVFSYRWTSQSIQRLADREAHRNLDDAERHER